MEVYIEDVFLDNFIIDFILLLITAKLLKLQYSKLKIFLASSLGMLFALANIFLTINPVPLFLYKLLSGFLMILVAFNTRSVKKIFLTYIVFLFVTFIVGGACLAICLTFGNISFNNGVISYQTALPLGIIILIISVICYFLFQSVNSIKKITTKSDFIFLATIFQDGKKIKTKAFLDTGNTIVDPNTNKPIIFISYNNFKKLFKDISLQNILLKKNINLNNMHYIKASTINSQNEILVFTVDKINLSQNKKQFTLLNPCFALTFKQLEQKLDCGVLLNFNTFNGENYE